MWIPRILHTCHPIWILIVEKHKGSPYEHRLQQQHQPLFPRPRVPTRTAQKPLQLSLCGDYWLTNPWDAHIFGHLDVPASALVVVGSFVTLLLSTLDETCCFADISTAHWRRCSDWVYISLQRSSFPISCGSWQAALLWQHAPIFLHNARSIRNGAQIARSDLELQEGGIIMVWIPCRQKWAGSRWRVQTDTQDRMNVHQTNDAVWKSEVSTDGRIMSLHRSPFQDVWVSIHSERTLHNCWDLGSLKRSWSSQTGCKANAAGNSDLEVKANCLLLSLLQTLLSCLYLAYKHPVGHMGVWG